MSPPFAAVLSINDFVVIELIPDHGGSPQEDRVTIEKNLPRGHTSQFRLVAGYGGLEEPSAKGSKTGDCSGQDGMWTNGQVLSIYLMSLRRPNSCKIRLIRRTCDLQLLLGLPVGTHTHDVTEGCRRQRRMLRQ